MFKNIVTSYLHFWKVIKFHIGKFCYSESVCSYEHSIIMSHARDRVLYLEALAKLNKGETEVEITTESFGTLTITRVGLTSEEFYDQIYGEDNKR